jgi:hypothetical protein
MSSFWKREAPERMIRFRRLPPIGAEPEEIISVSDLFRREALLLSHIWADHDLPPFEETNRILLSGLGDDGLVAHMWEPLQLSEREYKQLSRRVRKEGPERFIHNERTD